MLNDPEFVEAARVFAEQIIRRGGPTDEEKLNSAFETALARPIKANEKQSLQKFLAGQRAYYSRNPAESRKLARAGQGPNLGLEENEVAAWTSVCRVILNLHETIVRY